MPLSTCISGNTYRLLYRRKYNEGICLRAWYKAFRNLVWVTGIICEVCSQSSLLHCYKSNPWNNRTSYSLIFYLRRRVNWESVTCVFPHCPKDYCLTPFALGPNLFLPRFLASNRVEVFLSFLYICHIPTE